MAKWGEGDPRWLVEERPDATNVNNWHCTVCKKPGFFSKYGTEKKVTKRRAEKNASPWSKDKLTELLVGLKVKDDIGYCEIIEMTKCEGEAVVNNRKAKLIFLYEWSLILNWKGFLENSNIQVNGTVEIPNLSEEQELNDIDISVYVETKGPESELLKEMMRKNGTDKIRRCLVDYIKCLKEEFSKGLILPTKDNKVGSSYEVKNITNLPKKTSAVNEFVGNRKSTAKNQVETTRAEMTATFKCTAEEFYKALTVKEMVEAFTQGTCVLMPEKDGKFQFFGGNIHGYFTELVPNKRIKQKWRFKSWPNEHFSDVVIEIDEKDDYTEVCVSQSNIPKNDIERTREGWQRYYFQSMKKTFGFGAMLL